MTDREKDTTEATPEPHDAKKPVPRSYYYDDSTGYEVYEPENESEEADGDDDCGR